MVVLCWIICHSDFYHLIYKSEAMKLALPTFLVIVVFLLGFQVFSFVKEKHESGLKLDEAQKNLNQATINNEKLKAELEYLSNRANLEKELRSSFNLKKPGERMIILVPQKEQPTSTEETQRP
ncbi:MAG: Uncharacterized protein G01um101420_645 [Parcubacteria group bacterium Gr01-1014_20]|nr:MAG: Uncharacterized protein G01um101420_645 [Parcubacteria group bacterium Gr01-1014_20]